MERRILFLFIYFYICQTLPKCLTLNSRYILSYMNQTHDQTMCHCPIWLNWLFPFLPHEGAGRWVWLGFELNLLDAWPLPFSLDALCLDYCMDYQYFWFCPSCLFSICTWILQSLLCVTVMSLWALRGNVGSL